MKHVYKDITAQNQFSSGIVVDGSMLLVVDDTSSMSMTVVVQVSLDGGTSWIDTGVTATAASRTVLENGKGLQYRVGVKTGGFTSGTATVHLIA